MPAPAGFPRATGPGRAAPAGPARLRGAFRESERIDAFIHRQRRREGARHG